MNSIILIRKLLLTDTSSIEVARVVELLKGNKIPYTLVTKKSQNTFDNMIHASMSTSIGHGAPASCGKIVGEIFFTYNIYVRKRDYEKAKNLITE